MKNKTSRLSLRLAPSAAGFVLATMLPLAVSNATAFELDFGGVTGAFDTTLSYGTGWRMNDPDKALAGRGSYLSLKAMDRGAFINKNDGDANFDNNSEAFSSVFKVTSDLELKYSDYGFFASGTAFYDTTIMDHAPNRADAINNFPNTSSCNPQITTNPSACGFPSTIDSTSGHSARVLAAYVYGNFEIAGHALNLRAGEQVLSWGEALFLQNGVNSANPVSLSALRLPGSAIKEALLPLPMLYASLGLTEKLTAEAFYQFDWRYSRPDDVGTFYSSDDAFAGNGADRILIDTTGGQLQGFATSYNLNKYGVASPVLTTKHKPDINAKRDNQYGIAFRYSMDATEFGLYFMNYNSRIPMAQAVTGQMNGVQNGNAAAVAAFNWALANMVPAAQAVGAANAVNYIDTTQYQLVYPNDLHMVGLSFSTTAGDFSFSGELAYRPNDVILADLGDNLVAYNSVNAPQLANSSLGGCAQAGLTLNQGTPICGGGQIVKAWAEVETYNLDLVSIYNFGPQLGADGMTGVLEYGASFIPAGEDYRYASTAALLNLQGATALNPAAPKSEGPSNDYLDDLSMGYRAVLTATYNDVFAGVSLTPTVRFAHDFFGNSHRTGNFHENRKSATVALSALYNQKLEMEVGYNTFWGAKSSNLLGDRENITATVKYSF